MASMTAEDLNLRDLLDFDVDHGGPIRFGGERTCD